MDIFESLFSIVVLAICPVVTSWLPLNAIKSYFELGQRNNWWLAICVFIIIVFALYYYVAFPRKIGAPLYLTSLYFAFWCLSLYICIRKWNTISTLQAVSFCLIFLVHVFFMYKHFMIRIRWQRDNKEHR